nr:hypothetical protein [Tanacetum cinerariifolium]
MKAMLALSFCELSVIMQRLKSFQISGFRLVDMISRIVDALVEPTPVAVEANADSLAIERNLILLWIGLSSYAYLSVVTHDFGCRHGKAGKGEPYLGESSRVDISLSGYAYCLLGSGASSTSSWLQPSRAAYHFLPFCPRKSDPAFFGSRNYCICPFVTQAKVPMFALPANVVPHKEHKKKVMLVSRSFYAEFEGLNLMLYGDMVDMNLSAILMIGDDDIVAFGGEALCMWCLQPWRGGYPFTPSRTRNSEPNNFLNKTQHCHLMQVPMLVTKPQVPLELGDDDIVAFGGAALRTWCL